MATKPNPSAWLAGNKMTAANLTEGHYNVWRFLDVLKPVCQVLQTSVQAVPTSTFTIITFDSEVIDTDGQHSTVSNTSRIVIGNTLGWYRVSGQVAYAGNSAGSSRRARLMLNTGGVAGGHVGMAPPGSGFAAVPISPVYVQATSATDYLELQAWHDAGVSINTLNNSGMQSFLAAEYVGTLQ